MPQMGGMLIVALVLVPGTSVAQTVDPPRPSRFFVDIALAGTAGSPSRDRQFSSRFVRFGEIASSRATYPRPSRAIVSPLAEMGGGLTFARFLGAGVSHGRTAHEDVVSLEATILHPLFLDVPATAVGTSAALKRREAVTNVFLVVVPWRTRRAEWRVQFGPSFFRYTADMIRDVEFDHIFSTEEPSSSIVITGGATDQVRAADVGAHVGMDFTYFFTSRIGLGGRARYSQGTVTIATEPLSALRQELRVGSTLFFAGLRVRIGG